MVLQTLPFQFLVGGGVALAGGLIALLGLRHVWRASSVLRAPALADAADDSAEHVRLVGTVDAVADGAPVDAPCSGTPSLVGRTVVAERRIGANVPFLPRDVTVHEETDRVPFEVRTPAATATVDGRVGTAILDGETVATVAPGETPPDRILALDAAAEIEDGDSPLAGLPGPLAGLGRRVGLGRRTYREHRLEPGEEATVVGYPVGDGTVDPLVVSDRSPRGTVVAMARTGLVAVAIGAVTVAVGLGLLLVA